MQRRPNVVIVGAGFAGLRCADVLLQHGCAVTIFEARNRLGGRVAQSDQLGHTVDLGPNWIHGSHENPILRIAKNTGTELHAWDEEEAIFDSSGTLLGAAEAEECGRLLWDDGLIAEAFAYSEENTETIDASRSLYDFFAEKSKTSFNKLPKDVAKRRREILLQFTHTWGAYVGSPVDRQSLKFFWLEKTIEGENPFMAGTYAKILEAVARPARRGAIVKLNSRVERVVSLADNAGVSIETATGEKATFDEAVVTVPLGYLKRNATLFSPALPPRLTAAINDLGYGNLDKVYITFPSAFWNDPVPASKTASVPLDPEGTTPNVTATTVPLHQPMSSGGGGSRHFPGFAQWLPPSYAPDTNPARWDQQAMNLAALPASTAHPTLLFYVYGPCATYLASLLPSQKSPDYNLPVKPALLSFFLPYLRLLPNYCPSNRFCHPSAILATAWTNDEFAGYGSYSNFQVGLERGSGDIEVMREGCPERGVWFAGEHTAPFDALGTTTGAYVSGEKVARRVVGKYGRK